MKRFIPQYFKVNWTTVLTEKQLEEWRDRERRLEEELEEDLRCEQEEEALAVCTDNVIQLAEPIENSDDKYAWDEDDGEDYYEEDAPRYGDEIANCDALYGGDMPQSGCVVGIIRNCYGKPVCYKVWSHRCLMDTPCERDELCSECEHRDMIQSGFDYIPADKISLHEQSGNADWALGRIGYRSVWEDEDTPAMYINEETGDVIY